MQFKCLIYTIYTLRALLSNRISWFCQSSLATDHISRVIYICTYICIYEHTYIFIWICYSTWYAYDLRCLAAQRVARSPFSYVQMFKWLYLSIWRSKMCDSKFEKVFHSPLCERPVAWMGGISAFLHFGRGGTVVRKTTDRIVEWIVLWKYMYIFMYVLVCVYVHTLHMNTKKN